MGDDVVWISVSRAVPLLGVSRVQVVRMIGRGELTARRVGRVWRLDEHRVSELAAQRAEWVSVPHAAELARCATTRILRALKAGHITTRPRSGQAPTLWKADVTKLAAVIERERIEHGHQQQRRRELRAQAAARRQQRTTPPDNAQAWLSTAQAAQLIGRSKSHTRQLAAQGRLPHTRKDGILWFPRDNLLSEEPPPRPPRP